MPFVVEAWWIKKRALHEGIDSRVGCSDSVRWGRRSLLARGARPGLDRCHCADNIHCLLRKSSALEDTAFSDIIDCSADDCDWRIFCRFVGWTAAPAIHGSAWLAVAAFRVNSRTNHSRFRIGDLDIYLRNTSNAGVGIGSPVVCVNWTCQGYRNELKLALTLDVM